MILIFTHLYHKVIIQMSVFISYRFSNVPLENIHQLIDPIYNLLQTNGVDVFCNLYDKDKYENQKYTTKDIMDECFSMLETKNTILCLVDTNEYSCGMILEVGYALSRGKEIIICSRDGCQIKTLDHMANKTFIYHNYDELLHQIKNLFLIQSNV